MEHKHLHRRMPRAALPNPAAIASAAAEALASAFPNPFAEPEASAQQTIVSYVFVTASPTFEGSVGGYTTPGFTPTTSDSPTAASVAPTSTPDAQSSQSSTSADEHSSSSSSIVADTTSQSKSKSSSIVTHATSRSSSTSLPASIVPSSSVAVSLAIAVASSSTATSHQSSTLSGTASAASATSSTSSSSSGGLSAAGKAGLAIGILLLLGAVLAFVLFFFKKRKDAMKARLSDDEKTDMFAGAGRTASTRTSATAPRLSLRPITQFLPNLGDRRQSRGNVLAMASSPVSRPAEPRETGSALGNPMLSQDSNQNNPFGYHAETIDATNANGPTIVDSITPGGDIVSAAAAGAAGAGVIGLARGASKRENQPKQIDFTKGGPFRGPPSPAGTEFSISSESAAVPTQTRQGAAIAAAGGPAHSVVHRVQLDFKPSMDDELELRAGQLIRLLHEYDDGWALCIRLDRSQQGVVPRTCLSTRPVKPRPQQNGPRGPPPPGMRVPQQGRPTSPAMNQGPQGRPISPAMNRGPPQGRPMSPAMNQGPQGRPISPAMNRGPPQGRPMSPAMNQGPPRAMSPAGRRPMTPQGRPMTPNGPGPQNSMMQQGRTRAPSASQMQGRRNSPTGPSPMNPVGEPDIAGSPPLSRSPPTTGPISRKPVGQAL